jgi:hypothetical protein
MRLKTRVSGGGAALALVLALAVPGLAQETKPTTPGKPTANPAAQAPAPAPTTPTPTTTPAAQAMQGNFDPAVARRITPEDVKKRMDAGEKTIIVDSRSSTGDTIIKGAVHVPNAKLDAWAKDIAKDTLIVSYCT